MQLRHARALGAEASGTAFLGRYLEVNPGTGPLDPAESDLGLELPPHGLPGAQRSDHLPPPRQAMNRNRNAYSSASSPWLMVGQKRSPQASFQ